jgi:AcrR family transcriptional regulator
MRPNISQNKEFIVITAIDLIHENGINNVSTKEIARRLGISEALIFKIYPKKNDLYMAVLDHFSIYDKDVYQTAQDKYEDAVEAILFYFHRFLIYYENYPAITAVFQMIDFQWGIPLLEDRTKEIYLGRMEHVKQLVIRAQKEGSLKQSVEAEIVADLLFSAFKGICTKWRLMNYEFSLKDRADQAIQLLLGAVAIKER